MVVVVALLISVVTPAIVMIVVVAIPMVVVICRTAGGLEYCKHYTSGGTDLLRYHATAV